MLEKISSHPLVQAIRASLPVLFALLLLASLSTIGYHYLAIEILGQLAELTIQAVPFAVCGLMTYHLTHAVGWASFAVVLYGFHTGFLAAWLLSLLVSAVARLDQMYKKKHFIPAIPLFVENSVKDIFVCVFLIGLAFLPLPEALPFADVLDQPWWMMCCVFLNCLIFYKGYHPAFFNALIGPIEICFLAENIAAFLAGQPVVHLLTHGTMSAMCNLSGTGITIGIAFWARHKLSQGTLLSSFFGVNEPVIFGLPIANQKDCFIPFVIGGSLIGSLPIWLMYLGWLKKPILDAPYLGLGIEGMLVNLDFRSIGVALLQIVLSLMIWYPYYRKKVMKDEISI